MLQKHCFHWGQVNSQEKLLVLERDQKRDQAKSKALEILSPKFCRYLSTSKIIRANPHPRRPRGIQSGREKSAGRKFSSTGGRAPGYRLSPNYFQKFKRMPAPDWAQKMLCIIVPNRRTASPEFFFVSSYTTAIVSPNLPGSFTTLVRARKTFIFNFPNQKRRNVWDAISRSNSICPENILFLTDHNVS